MNSQSEFISQSKSCPEQAKRAERDPNPLNGSNHRRSIAIRHRRKPVRLKPGQAPWPTPPLRILARRQGKNLLPDPEEE